MLVYEHVARRKLLLAYGPVERVDDPNASEDSDEEIAVKLLQTSMARVTERMW